jgi:hypothetical protein
MRFAAVPYIRKIRPLSHLAMESGSVVIKGNGRRTCETRRLSAAENVRLDKCGLPTLSDRDIDALGGRCSKRGNDSRGGTGDSRSFGFFVPAEGGAALTSSAGGFSLILGGARRRLQFSTLGRHGRCFFSFNLPSSCFLPFPNQAWARSTNQRRAPVRLGRTVSCSSGRLPICFFPLPLGQTGRLDHAHSRGQPVLVHPRLLGRPIRATLGPSNVFPPGAPVPDALYPPPCLCRHSSLRLPPPSTSSALQPSPYTPSTPQLTRRNPVTLRQPWTTMHTMRSCTTSSSVPRVTPGSSPLPRTSRQVSACASRAATSACSLTRLVYSVASSDGTLGLTGATRIAR